MTLGEVTVTATGTGILRLAICSGAPGSSAVSQTPAAPFDVRIAQASSVSNLQVTLCGTSPGDALVWLGLDPRQMRVLNAPGHGAVFTFLELSSE